MIIFLDTNIFFNNWQLRNVEFTYLFNFISNENDTLLLSDLVVDETESNRKKELGINLAAINKAIKSINQICGQSIEPTFGSALDPYNFKEMLEEKIDSEFIEYLPYDNVNQKEVVERAIAHRRPFRESEKGYRDTLIWLSLLNYLKDKKVKQEIAFISANSEDFFKSRKRDSKEPLSFLPSLIEDIELRDIDCKITPYNSLNNFITENIVKNEHVIAYNELDKIEDDIERHTINALNEWSTEELKKSFEYYEPVISALLTVNNHFFHIDEGMEDGTVLTAEHLKGKLIFVNYQYNFRICSLQLTISKEEYNVKQGTFPKHHNIIDEDFDEVILEFYFRVYFNSSFQFDSENKIIDGLYINTVDYR